MDTLNIRCVAQAIAELVAAEKEWQEARDRYEGCSPEYYLRYVIDRRESAAEQLETELNKYIDSRIRAHSPL